MRSVFQLGEPFCLCSDVHSYHSHDSMMVVTAVTVVVLISWLRQHQLFETADRLSEKCYGTVWKR
jgi:hypothetical protein